MNKTRISSFITSLSVTTMWFQLGCCGPLRVMLGSVFILAAIFVVYVRYFPIFPPFMIDIESQQCKFYASVMKSNLLNVQRLLLSSFMA